MNDIKFKIDPETQEEMVRAGHSLSQRRAEILAGFHRVMLEIGKFRDFVHKVTLSFEVNNSDGTVTPVWKMSVRSRRGNTRYKIDHRTRSGELKIPSGMPFPQDEFVSLAIEAIALRSNLQARMRREELEELNAALLDVNQLLQEPAPATTQ